MAVIKLIWWVTTFSFVGFVTLPSEAKRSPLSKHTPYFDLTEAIDRKNETEIIATLKLTRYIFYRTDQPLPSLVNLSWVAEDLLKLDKKVEDSGKPPLSLILSFQITLNDSSIISSHYEDLIFSFSNPAQARNDSRTTDLGKLLSGVFLDFQTSWPNTHLHNSDITYLKKWDISFVKYARKFVEIAFGKGRSRIKVGVIYNEQQIGRDWELARMELSHADYLIINVDLIPLFKMPLDRYQQLDQHIRHVIDNNKEFCKNASRLYKQSHKENQNTLMMVSWKGSKHAQAHRIPEDGNKTPGYNKALSHVIASSEHKYLAIFEEFVGIWFERHNKFPMVISGHIYNISERDQSSFIDKEPADGVWDTLLAQLYVHQTDVTPCQLKTMLKHIATKHATLVVNEYTLAAYVNGQTELTECPNRANQTEKSFKSTILLGTEGIRRRLPAVKKLLSSSSVTKLNLSTVVFSQADLNTTLEYSTVAKFVNKELTPNNINAGCMVILENGNFTVYPQAIVKIAESRCNVILSQTKIMFWQIPINTFNSNLTSEGLPQELAMEYFRSSLKRSFINVIIARQMMMEKYTSLEIVLYIDTPKEIDQPEKTFFCPVAAENRFQFEFGRVLHKFSRLHDVRYMFKPVFDMNYHGYGWYLPPNENGAAGRMIDNKCTK